MTLHQFSGAQFFAAIQNRYATLVRCESALNIYTEGSDLCADLRYVADIIERITAGEKPDLSATSDGQREIFYMCEREGLLPRGGSWTPTIMAINKYIEKIEGNANESEG